MKVGADMKKTSRSRNSPKVSKKGKSAPPWDAQGLFAVFPRVFSSITYSLSHLAYGYGPSLSLL